MICNVCGSENLLKGSTYDNAGGSTIGFIPDETSPFKKMFAMGGREVQSYGCIHCGNLQFLIDFTEEDKQQHLEFHRQPPSITEDSDAEE